MSDRTLRSHRTDQPHNPDDRARHKPREFESVGSRRDESDEEEDEDAEDKLGTVKELGQFVIRHRWTIMSYFSVSTLAVLSGIWITYYRIGTVNKEAIVKEVKDDLLRSDDFVQAITRSVAEETEIHLKDKLQATEKTLQDKFNRTLDQTMEEFNESYSQEMNATKTNFQEQMASFSRDFELKMNGTLKEKIAEFSNSFGRKMSKTLENKAAEFNRNVEQKINQTKTNMTLQMEAMKVGLSQRLDTNLEDARNVMNDVESKTGRLQKLVEQIDTKQNFAAQLMEMQGFMKIDNFGPVLLVLGVVEALLALSICILFSRGVAHRAVPGQERRQEGNPGAQATSQPRPPRLIDTSNSVAIGLCFRVADEDLTKALGSQLVASCPSPKPHLRTFVVNCMEDVQEIPACRAALVFVDPDEREMIIEDERYHIGQGLRRHAVQRLLDSGVEVFVIIFNDKKSVNLPSEQLYNTKLGQVDEHAQLKMLKRKGRVFSIRDKFHDHQSPLLVRELSSIFS